MITYPDIIRAALTFSEFLEFPPSGSKKRDWVPSGKLSTGWKGYQEISLTVWNSYRQGARARGKKFEISVEYAWQVYLRQNRQCALTGLPISFSKTRRSGRTASLDRVDSELGYVPGNVQWVHSIVNRMKLDLPENVLKALAILIVGRSERG